MPEFGKKSLEEEWKEEEVMCRDWISYCVLTGTKEVASETGKLQRFGLLPGYGTH